jgi:hypothetical protein
LDLFPQFLRVSQIEAGSGSPGHQTGNQAVGVFFKRAPGQLTATRSIYMTHMKDMLKYQNCISKVRRAGANASLALVAVLASAAITAPPAQAQTFTVLHTFDSTDGGHQWKLVRNHP